MRYALQSADGVAEVASVGGFVKEYQIDVNPISMREHGIQLTDVFNAVRQSNLDVGARTIEVNRVEYMVRGLGFIKSHYLLDASTRITLKSFVVRWEAIFLLVGLVRKKYPL